MAARLSESPRHAEALHKRRYELKNRERLNRLLLLLQLQANGLADETIYSQRIHDWLLANGGRPLGARRAIADAGGVSSLPGPDGARDTPRAVARSAACG